MIFTLFSLFYFSEELQKKLGKLSLITFYSIKMTAFLIFLTFHDFLPICDLLVHSSFVCPLFLLQGFCLFMDFSYIKFCPFLFSCFLSFLHSFFFFIPYCRFLETLASPIFHWLAIDSLLVLWDEGDWLGQQIHEFQSVHTVLKTSINLGSLHIFPVQEAITEQLILSQALRDKRRFQIWWVEFLPVLSCQRLCKICCHSQVTYDPGSHSFTALAHITQLYKYFTQFFLAIFPTIIIVLILLHFRSHSY